MQKKQSFAQTRNKLAIRILKTLPLDCGPSTPDVVSFQFQRRTKTVTTEWRNWIYQLFDSFHTEKISLIINYSLLTSSVVSRTELCCFQFITAAVIGAKKQNAVSDGRHVSNPLLNTKTPPTAQPPLRRISGWLAGGTPKTSPSTEAKMEMHLCFRRGHVLDLQHSDPHHLSPTSASLQLQRCWSWGQLASSSRLQNFDIQWPIFPGHRHWLNSILSINEGISSNFRRSHGIPKWKSLTPTNLPMPWLHCINVEQTVVERPEGGATLCPSNNQLFPTCTVYPINDSCAKWVAVSNISAHV